MTCPQDGYIGATTLVVGKEDIVHKLLYIVAFTKHWSLNDINNSSKF